ncbi:acid sphingomyelinase-like phosphodiesterase 3a [Anthonomus grandis grandis]|uniref:acid sphingomyelinase-like phosphodiesterase 3a n=1 Tax=Anthonomus grandis grandis TaxID=2921223 RepID=UPI0021651E03|nr:acid sphingomyelinase-like phosphodiesterase 3a [Anthonomus grandis grandis]
MKMWWLSCLGLLLTVSAKREEYDKIGYFWQITDIHYDEYHSTLHGGHKKGSGCLKQESISSNRDGNKAQRSRSQYNDLFGRFGEYNCDSSWELIESAAKFMKSKQSDNVEFVLWTGDGLSHFATHHISTNRQMEIIQGLTDLLGKTFPAQFVFPALGHDDPVFRKHLGRMWSRWLPTDSMKTFDTGGYYIIERKQLKLQIVVLNTNLMKKSEVDEEALKQWKWLEKWLQKFKRSKETAYLVGHVPPGWDERQKGLYHPSHGAYSEYHNRIYIELIRNYSDIIVGQFYGHLHSDTFRVFYDKGGRPISWALIAPSVTPKRNHIGPNNPGLRLYKFDKDTGQIFDYTQYYLDLSQANKHFSADWTVEYNFTTYYEVNQINALNLHNLAKKFVNGDPDGNILFEKYYKANTVKVISHPKDMYDLGCIHNHFCAITQVDFIGFEECLIRTSMIRSQGKQLSISLLVLNFLLIWNIRVLYV